MQICWKLLKIKTPNRHCNTSNFLILVGSQSGKRSRKFRQNISNDQKGNGEIRKMQDSRFQSYVYQVSRKSFGTSVEGKMIVTPYL